MLTPLLVISWWDPTFSLVCVLFAPPFFLSLTLLLHALHRHDFRLWSLKLHLYHSAARLHLPSLTLPSSFRSTGLAALFTSLVVPYEAQCADENGDAAASRVALKDASVLLPQHRQAELRQQKERDTAAARLLSVPSRSAALSEPDPDHPANAAQRLALSPLVSLSLLLALLTPTLILAAWCAVLIALGYVVTALSLVFLSCSLVSLLVAVVSWHRRGWSFTPHVEALLGLSLASYLTLTLLLTFLLSSSSSPVTFFARSVQFLALHLVLTVEAQAVHQRAHEAQLAPYLQYEGRQRDAEDEKDHNTARTKHALRTQKARDVLGTDEPIDAEAPARAQSTPQVARHDDSDEEDEEGGTQAKKPRLQELPSHTHSFASHVLSRIHRARVRHASRASSRLLTLHVASALTLVAYSLVIFFQASAPNESSSSTFDPRFMGLLVSLTVVFFDGVLGLLQGEVRPWVMLGMGLLTRLVLASFDARSWFVGYCILFAAFALLLVRVVVSSYLPWWGVRVSAKARTLSVEAKPMTLERLLSYPPRVLDSFPVYARPLPSAIQPSTHPSTVPKLLLMALLTLYLMATAVAYSTTPPTFASIEQWQLGLLVLVATAVAALAFLLVRLLFFFSFAINAATAGCALLMEAVFVGCGVFVWEETGSVLALLLASLMPPFGVSLLATWTLSICDAEQRWSRRSLLCAAACVVLLAGVGLAVSELFSPSFIGWTIVLVVIIVLTGCMPLVKYHSTLTIDGLDELAIVVSLTLLAGLVGLLCAVLDLDLMPALLLVAGGAAFPVLLMLVAAYIDYGYQRVATPLCVFAVAEAYAYLVAVAVLTLAVVDVWVGVIVSVATVLVILFSALFLYWSHRGYRLPLALRVAVGGLVGAVLAAGVMLAMYLALWYEGSGTNSDLPFFAFSATWFFLLACLLLYAALTQRAATSGPSMQHFSPAVFPVYLYSKRTGALTTLHAPVMLALLSVLLFLLWSFAALVLSYVSLALASSTVALLLTYLGLRHLTMSSTEALLPLLPLLDEATLRRVHADVWKAHSAGWEGDPVRDAVVRAIERGDDVLKLWTTKQRQQRAALGLYSTRLLPSLWHLLLSSPTASAMDLDFLVGRLSRTEETMSSLSSLLHAMAAHSFFLLSLAADSRLHEEAAVYALFRVWLQRTKRVRLDERLQAEDVWTWDAARRRDVSVWVDEWKAHKAKEREGVEQSRVIDSHTTARRTDLVAFKHALSRGAEPPPADPYGGLKAAGARGSAPPPRPGGTKKTAAAAMEKVRQQHAIAQGRAKAQSLTATAAIGKAKGSTALSHARKAGHDSPRATRDSHSEEKAEASKGKEDELEEGAAHNAKDSEERPHNDPPEEGAAKPDDDEEKAEKEPDESKESAPHDDEDEQAAKPSHSAPTAQADDDPAAGRPAAFSTSAAAAASSSSASSESFVVPLVVHDHEEAHALFARIQAQYEVTGVKWTDVTFPAAPSSIYVDGERDPTRPSAVHQVVVDGWKRPEEILQGMKDNGAEGVDGEALSVSLNGAFSCADVIQGNIGTCYLLSALGVMAQHKAEASAPPLLASVLPVLTSTPSHACGCYLVALYHAHAPYFVLIDDLLPVLANSSPAFSHCRKPGELWVALIEKAYAKAATSYEAIQGGYIHQALIDLSSSHGEELRLKAADGSLRIREEELFTRLSDEWAAGAMIGAGSNTGTNDHEVNGIVQGHAYAVIGLYAEAEPPLRLIRLRNPWGSGEWTGDWGDDSDRWTRFYKNRLSWKAEDDGTFWMAFSDFLQAFENVYLCKLMPHRVTLSAAWSVSAGTAAGPKAPTTNPQFALTSAVDCTVYVEMEQGALEPKEVERLEAGETMTGVGANGFAYIQVYFVEAEGKRVEKIVKAQVKGWANDGKLVNTRLISAQVSVEAGKTYTVLCCTNMEGVERAFSLTVFSPQPIELTAID